MRNRLNPPSVGGKLMGRIATLGEGIVGGGAEIVDCVEECPVKVKYYKLFHRVTTVWLCPCLSVFHQGSCPLWTDAQPYGTPQVIVGVAALVATLVEIGAVEVQVAILGVKF